MMPTLTEIKSRINAVSETRKITSTMKLVSTSRIKKLMRSLSYNRMYFDSLTGVMRDIISSIGKEAIDHPYIVGHTGIEAPKQLYIVVAGDRGLCGAYNRDVLEFAYKTLSGTVNPSIATVGKMASNYLAKKPIRTNGLRLKFTSEHSLGMIRRMVNSIGDLYDKGYIDELYIIYTPYLEAGLGKPEMRQVLPLMRRRFIERKEGDGQEEEEGEEEGAEGSEDADPDAGEGAEKLEITYVIGPKETFDRLVPQYLIGLIYDILFQAYAGEQFARMNAMEASTDNADELLGKLQLNYNMTRQANITNEIAEVASAAALNDLKKKDEK